MQEPERFEELGPGWALKLIKAIYGLKQAGRQWHKKLDSALSTLGFCYDRGGFPGDTLDRVREYGVNAQELVTTSSTRLLMTT